MGSYGRLGSQLRKIKKRRAIMDLRPIHFIEEPIQVFFDEPPLLEKKPVCPTSFTFRDDEYKIIELISEWRDYRRKGRMARNMQPQHSTVAESRGSWGVGVFYFRVKTDKKRIFDIYYDRLPQNVDKRKGGWFLYQELSTQNPHSTI